MHCVNNPIRLFAFRVQVTDSIFQERHCERKRSNPCCREVRVDCFVALLLAMTARLHILAARRARDFARTFAALRTEGAGNAGCPMHPQPRTQNKKRTSVVTTVTPERPGIPRAMVLRLTSRSPRRSGLLSPSSARLLADLTPASGRQNHTTSPSASAPFVTRAARVHRIPPRVRDVRTPLCWDGTVRD